MNKAAFKDLLHRYLANNCSDKERLLVEGFYDVFGEEKDFVLENLDSLEDDLWKRIKEKIHLNKQTQTEDITKFIGLKPRYRRHSCRVAASIVLLIGGGFSFFQYDSERLSFLENKTLVSQHRITITTQAQMDVFLDDSMQVYLLPESQLNIPIAFGKHINREILLTGEPIFDVTKIQTNLF